MQFARFVLKFVRLCEIVLNYALFGSVWFGSVWIIRVTLYYVEIGCLKSRGCVWSCWTSSYLPKIGNVGLS